MPAQNGTGPTGEGPLTGRGMGQCNPNLPEGTQSNIGGLGLGRGRRGGFFGGGRRLYRRSGFFRPQWIPSSQSEAETLKQQASILEENLNQIKRRLEDLEK